MNTENAEFLKDRLFFLGFGDKLNAELEKNLKAEPDKFKLPMTAEFSKGDKKDVVEYTLDFTKSKQNDMYFLNSYHAKLMNLDPEKEKAQTFYINKGKGVTAKEAYNLLDGRAVHKELTSKEGEPYKAWLQLNATKEENGNHKVQQFHSAWGYNVEKSLAKHSIKELNDPDQKTSLIKSLEKGNLQAVTYNRDNKEEKMFLEANPKERNVIVYNEQMQKQFQGVKEHTGEKKGVNQNKSDDTNSEKAKHEKKDAKEDPEPQRKAAGRKMSA